MCEALRRSALRLGTVSYKTEQAKAQVTLSPQKDWESPVRSCQELGLGTQVPGRLWDWTGTGTLGLPMKPDRGLQSVNVVPGLEIVSSLGRRYHQSMWRRRGLSLVGLRPSVLR